MHEVDKSEAIVLHRAQDVNVITEEDTVSLEFLVALEGRNVQSVRMTIDFDTAFSMIRAITRTMMTRGGAHRPAREIGTIRRRAAW
jgi:hypothetical protein